MTPEERAAALAICTRYEGAEARKLLEMIGVAPYPSGDRPRAEKKVYPKKPQVRPAKVPKLTRESAVKAGLAAPKTVWEQLLAEQRIVQSAAAHDRAAKQPKGMP